MWQRKRMAWWSVALVVVAGAAWLMLTQAARQAPDFYERAVSAPIETQRALGEEFERRALELHNKVRRSGHWQMEITADQINGWLAVDLPAKFPDLLSAAVQQPRVAIDRDQLRLACRSTAAGVNAVLCLVVEVSLTDQQNVIAIRLAQARAGWLPLPLKRVTDEVTMAALNANLQLRWVQQDGDPVALLTIPSKGLGSNTDDQLVLESLQLRPNRIILAGRTGPANP